MSMMALAVVVVAAVGLLSLAPVVAVIAWLRATQLRRELKELQSAVAALSRRLDALGRPSPPPEPRAEAEPPPVAAGPAKVAAGVTTAAPPEAPSAAPGVPAAPTGTVPAVPAPSKEPSPPPSAAPRPLFPAAAGRGADGRDFATSVGPRLMIAAGALAFVVFLGLFVKHAWENNWVGPTGRVLAGAAVGLGLVAAGLRLLGREYRPLGQGLAGAGLASLYVSAFGAHGFYDLISREAAGVLMAAITANAVLLAARLDARLLAGLAWIGGYLTPLLLSTGEDRALALFLYLALLDVGAMVLDRRKPWPETVPLALLGTCLLYLGWFARFFRPERFEVAAFGLLLFAAIFALGPAHRRRGRLEGVFGLAAFGLAALAQADRPEWLLILSLSVAAAALRLTAGLEERPPLAAALAVGLPLAVWWGMHYRPEAFGFAAAWVVLGALLFLVPALVAGAGLGNGMTGAVLVATGFASVSLAASTDRPAALSLFLVAQAGLAVLARRRWPWAEAVGVSAAALATSAWFDRFFRAEGADQALLLALPVAGAYLVSLVARGATGKLAGPDAAAHLITAAFLWGVLRNVLHDTRPEALGLAAVVLATLYLALGLVALRARPLDALQARVELGLAAVFVTLAIPVQLGLNGITLGWAAEGVLLLALGLRFGSPLARAGGYAVLGLAALRLFARHLAPPPEPFRPLFNAQFGAWLAVVAAFGTAVWLLRRTDTALRRLDVSARLALGAAGLGLLFIALTTETRTTFAVRGRLAAQAGDAAAAEAAALAGGLALSVLWTAFATGLLAAGLALRSRALFYSAYALFAFTALKVVFVDLATLHTVYRMLSFLALAVLLMGGAYLNLRFRARLLPREAG